MNTKNYKKNNSMKTLPPKKKTIDRNQLLAYLLAVLIIFWTVASVFGLIAYARTKKSNRSGVISASAQTVDDISTSGQLEIELPYLSGLTLYDGYGRTTTYGDITLLLSNTSLILNTSIDLFQLGVSTDTLSVSRSYTYSNTVQGGGYQFLSNTGRQSLSVSYDDSYDIVISDIYEVDAIFLDYYFYYDIVQNDIAVAITLRVDYNQVWHSYTFEIYYPYEYDVTSTTFASPYYYIPFIEARFNFNVTRNITNTLGYGIPTAEFLKYYKLTSTLSPDALLTYDMAYDKGYENGLKEGREQGTGNAYNEGKQDGYAEGKRDGLAEGKSIGYNEGLDDANVYTFDKLLSSVFDVPVRTFTSLFNFELLGFNLLDFFLALFSAGVILAIIRLIL